MAWSISKLKTYACPLRFKRLYIEKRSEPSSDAANVGKACAEIMAQVRINHLGGVETTDEAMLHLGKIGSDGDEAQAARAVGIVKDALERMPDILPPPENVASWNVETGLAFDEGWNRLDFDQKGYYSGEWGEAFFTCKPDFAWMDKEGILHIEDDKSGWGKYDSLQVNAYAFSVANVLKAKGIAVNGVSCRYNFLSKGTYQYAENFQVEDVADFPDYINSEVNRINSDTEHKPVMGKHCDWCGFVSECPAHQRTEQLLTTLTPETMKQITTHEQAVAGGLWLLAAERVVQAAKDKLKAYVLENGTVVLPETGKELRMVGGSDWEATAGDVFEALCEAGIPKNLFFDRLTVKKRHVDEILKGAFPLGGKGITKEVKAENKEAQRIILEQVRAVGIESPRKAVLMICNEGEKQ